MKKTDLQYQIALSLVDGIGNRLAKILYMYNKSAKAIFEQTPTELHKKIPGVGIKIAQKLTDQKKEVFKQAQEILRKAEEQEVTILSFFEEGYPDALREFDDSPIILYLKGNIKFNTQKTLAIVGTRQATEYGREAVEKILQDLLPYNPLIVSGLAYGIDINAHKLALKLGLNTLGIMANGIDIIYPFQHQKIATEMTLQGGLLTESTFGTKPDARRFPARNRIIAGLCQATLIVEAQSQGGAMITANFANEYGKEVFAVPGSIKSPTSAGCNLLIQQNKANLVTSGKDIAEVLKWKDKLAPHQQTIMPLETFDLSEEEKNILKFLKEKDEVQIDTLAYQLNMPIHEITASLLNLELLDLVKVAAGQKYKLKK
jgi:DNA processing protein